MIFRQKRNSQEKEQGIPEDEACGVDTQPPELSVGGRQVNSSKQEGTPPASH